MTTQATPARKPWLTAWRRLRRNRTAVAGLVLLGVILVACLSAPLIFDYQRDIVGVNIAQRLQIPVEGKPLGTDELGRNLLARILWGGRTSLKIGIGSVLLASLVATTIGTAAAYYGGRTDSLLMRALDVLLAIPAMLLMITFVAIMAPTQTNLMLAISVSFVPSMARLVRAQVLSVKDLEYVAAVRAQGASDVRVLLLHVLPNAIGPVIVSFVMYIPGGIMTISGLGFIGLGVQPPNPEWGSMLASGRAFIRDAWHITTLPGAAIVLTIIALTLVGDGLRDAIDSRMSNE
ncbi:MAG TPA: ABC transporter permease [Trueperaceae bacterium]|nr:ABC transporter permease [Trueperaceae bacterium]